MPHQDQFTYERLLKILAGALTPEQFEKLIKWKFLHNACETYLSNISTYRIDNEEPQSNDAKAFFEMENEIKNLTTEVFLTLPNPNELRQRWDEGAAKKNAHTQEQAVGELAEFISNQYQLIREALSNAKLSHQEYKRLEDINNTNKVALNLRKNTDSLTTTKKYFPPNSKLEDDFF